MGAWDAVKQFCQASSIKGLARMVKAKRMTLRIMWALCVLIGSSVALYQITTIFQGYFAYETSTLIEELEDVNPIFPDVTVCKSNPPPILMEDDHAGLTFSAYLESVNILLRGATQKEVDTLEELKSLDGYFQTITDKYLTGHLARDDTLNFTVACVFRHRNGDDTDCTTSSSTRIPRFLTPSFPACLTFKPPTFADRKLIQSITAIFYLDDFNPHLVPHFGLDVDFPQTSGVMLFTHAPNTFPNLLRGLVGSSGMETAVLVSDVRHARVEDPYSDCSGASYEQIDEDADFSYTERSCRDNCTQMRVISECGCLDPRAPTFTSQRANYSFCGMLSNSTEASAGILHRLQCLYNNTDSRNDGCDKKCVNKCSNLKYDYHSMGAIWPHESRQLAFYETYIKDRGYPSALDTYADINDQANSDPTGAYKQLQMISLIRRNFLKIKVYFDGRSVVRLRDNAVHTLSSVSGSLGGILNLWIGISFVTIIEIAELVYHLFTKEPTGQANTQTAQHLNNVGGL